MKKTNKFFILIILAVFVLSLAACGAETDGLAGNNDDNENTLTPPAYEPEMFIDCKVSAEYSEIIKPISDAALYMVSDLLAKEKLNITLRQGTDGETVTLNLTDFFTNPRLVYIRFCYGRSISIAIDGDLFCDDGSVSKFLRNCFGVDLEDIYSGIEYSAEYETVLNFFEKERLLRGKENYSHTVKPLANAAAEALLNAYAGFDGDAECYLRGDGDAIYINKDNSDEYDLIRGVVNGYITGAKERKDSDDNGYQKNIERLPIINDCEIKISLGYTAGNNPYYTLSYEVISDNATITIETYFTFNDEFTSDYFYYFMGVSQPGYWMNQDLAPNNDEYSDFFQTLVKFTPGREKIIHSTFRTESGENTIIYLPETVVLP